MKKFLALISLAALSAAPAAAKDVTLCTGSADGNYYAAGLSIKQMAPAGLQIVVKESNGTLENLDRTIELASDDPSACDAFIGQPDGPVYFGRTNPSSKSLIRQVGELHREYLHVLFSQSSGIDDLGDLSGSNKYSLAIGEPGSGAWLVWQNIVAEDNSYTKVPVSNEGGILALSAVASGVTDGMIVPAGLGNGTISAANERYASSIALVPANDKDFNDAVDVRGKPLYTYKDIPGKIYKNLTCGTFSCSSTSTISWQAGVYVNIEKFKDRRTLAQFADAVGRATPGIVSRFGE